MNKNDFEAVLNTYERNFEKLCENGKTIIEHQLEEAGVPVSSIVPRIKTKQSALDKQKRKNYKIPLSEMTDLVGFRVIVFVESDVEKVESILRSTFEVDEENCVDKRKKSVDQVGYRSLHLVCSLGENRKSVPEYKEQCDFKFEIQIRTALENAWAEVEHKQNYKGQHALPEQLQRRLMILSGTLELLDKEFSNIVLEAEQYRAGLRDESEEFLTDKISVTSIEVFFQAVATKFDKEVEPVSSRFNEHIIQELLSFGIETNYDLKKLIEETEEKAIQDTGDFTLLGFYRNAMMAKSLETFLTECYTGQFTFLLDEMHFLENVCGHCDVEATLMAHNADIDRIHWSDLEDAYLS